MSKPSAHGAPLSRELIEKPKRDWTMFLAPRVLIAFDELTADWDDGQLIADLAASMWGVAPPPSAIVANVDIGEPAWCYWRRDED
jgi:hypothetical protein